MNKVRYIFGLLLLFAPTLSYAQDDQVVFSLLDRSSTSPVQVPKQITIKQDEVFVLSKPTKHVIIPTGVVSVREYQVKKDSIFAVFGKIAGEQTDGIKEYEGPSWIYIVSPKNAGTCDLISIPVGLTDSSQITTLRLVVSGLAPQPPPVDPIPSPGPKPAAGIRVLLIINEDAKIDQLNAAGSLDVVEWLDRNCVKDSEGKPEWRRYDRSIINNPGVLDKETPLLKKLWLDVKDQVPQGSQMVIATGSTVVVKPIINVQTTLTELNNLIGVRK